MPLHFKKSELEERRARTCALMVEQGLDGMLIFRQESMYYLTGYDTFGYVFFQCLYMGADGRLVLLTRAPDLRQAQFTSVIEDIRIWRDGVDAKPANDLRDILSECGCKGKRLGVEWEAYGLTANNGRALEQALDGFCTLTDASLVVSRLRLIKSDAEIKYLRLAAGLADDAWGAAIELAKPGVFEGDILAAMHSAIYSGGGDDPANEFIIGSGPGALMCRYFSGRRTLDQNDQLTLEWAGTYRHYHAAMMHTMVIGNLHDRQADLYKAARDALAACEEALRPGQELGAVFDAHAAVLDKAGLAAHRLNACGYSMGAVYSPCWMDWPMLYNGNKTVAEPGMAFFLHMIIFDSDTGLAASLGRTSIVTKDGSKALSDASLDLVVK